MTMRSGGARRFAAALSFAAALTAAAMVGSHASAATRGTIKLKPGQSTKVGSTLVVCTTKSLKRTKTRIVLHPGHQVKVRSTTVRCVKAVPPPPVPPPVQPPPPPQQGLRANPWPLGYTVGFDNGWKVKVNSVNFDAWSVIQPVDSSNQPPAAGYVDVMTNVTLTWLGTGQEKTSDLRYQLAYVGAAHNQEYKLDEFSSYRDCGFTPGYNTEVESLFQGSSGTYNLCAQVQADDVPTLLLVWDIYNNGFFALR